MHFIYVTSIEYIDCIPVQTVSLVPVHSLIIYIPGSHSGEQAAVTIQIHKFFTYSEVHMFYLPYLEYLTSNDLER